jgi:coenzyme F420 biosynthesis associated uncharacterized protein
MLDRALAQRIAGVVASEGPVPVPPSDLAAICADAEQRVVAYTGLRPATALPPAEAVGRPDWTAANLASMAEMLGPLADRGAGAAGPLGGVVRGAVGLVLTAEAGALTGYLSQRVLGQYELTLTDPDRAPRLLFVGPNIEAATDRLGADRRELWTWIAVHEVTHAVQFASVPWLREHVAGLLTSLMESLEVSLDPAALLRLPRADDLRALADAVRRDGLLAVAAGPERRALLDRLQVTMAVIEGHAEHVMDAVGADVVGSLDDLRAAMDRRRRERPPALRLLERLIGLETKMRQYEDGKRFCDAVVDAAGVPALHSVFETPNRLPSPAELADPAAWLRRCAA